MKTTNKFIAAGLVAASLLAGSCTDDFLNVSSKTQESIEDYFTTDAHVQEAVVAAYHPLGWNDFGTTWQYNPLHIMSDIMADDLWVGGSDKNDNAFWHLMMNYEALPTNCMTGIWVDFYSGVKRCNDVLTYIGWADDITEQHAKYYEAQARVLRDYYYNHLWKFWGNIPYFEQNLDFPYIAEQLSADEVYGRVIADLEGAIALDALPMRESATGYGRVTKAMAYMLYAEMVMYQNDESRFGTALKYMEEIINSGEYGLMSNYGGIFKETGEWGIESIFEVNYKNVNAERNWGSPITAGGTVLPRLISPSNWPDGTDGHDNGWGFAPVRVETYNRYSANDARRDATCWNAAAVASYDARYQDTGYFLEKYAAHTGDNVDHHGDADLNYNNNLRVYRYAETLLNAAELIVRGAGAGDAAGYLNMVRNRAGLSDTAATLDNIIEERHLEFVGEGKRYWDLIRTGKASTVLVPDQYGYRTNTWSENKKYLPIPQSEIDAAQNTLKQNNY